MKLYLIFPRTKPPSHQGEMRHSRLRPPTRATSLARAPVQEAAVQPLGLGEMTVEVGRSDLAVGTLQRPRQTCPCTRRPVVGRSGPSRHTWGTRALHGHSYAYASSALGSFALGGRGQCAGGHCRHRHDPSCSPPPGNELSSYRPFHKWLLKHLIRTFARSESGCPFLAMSAPEEETETDM